ncbi:MAG TPA: hypothetical protein VLT57_10225 [Bryobacteraceae bacterium]|nr:hypothetical protein [Bryobacteraceae bacterium]
MTLEPAGTAACVAGVLTDDTGGFACVAGVCIAGEGGAGAMALATRALLPVATSGLAAGAAA